MRIALILVSLLHVSAGSSLLAQWRTAPLVDWEPPAFATESSSSRAAAARNSEGLGDYRYEGLAIGGLSFGAWGVWIGSQISAACPLEVGAPCDTGKTEDAVALGLAGAVLGGGLGYLVGRLSPKRPPRIETELPALELVTVPDSVRKRARYQHWRGGAIGALTGVLGHAVARCDDCGQELSVASTALTTGLVGAGAGGVLGFLAGLSSPKYAWIPTGAQ
jgi:hypothetical protein